MPDQDPIGDALRGMGVKTDGAMKIIERSKDSYRAVICLDGGKDLLFVRVSRSNVDGRDMWISTAEVNDVATEEVTQIEDSDWTDDEWNARFKGKEPSTEQPHDPTEAARRAISRLHILPTRYTPCFEKKERQKQQRVTAGAIPRVAFLVPVGIVLLLLASLRVMTAGTETAVGVSPTATGAGTTGAIASGGRVTVAPNFVPPVPSELPQNVIMGSKLIRASFDHDGVCDPYVVRFYVNDPKAVGHTVVLQEKVTPLKDAIKAPTLFDTEQRIEGIVGTESPYIEAKVYAFTTVDVTAVSLDGKTSTGSYGWGNKGAADCVAGP